MVAELEFEPGSEVKFKGALQDPVPVEVKVKNGTGKKMAYKVKCSDNDLFKIRPVMGILKDGESATVTLTFTAKDKGKKPTDKHHFSLYQIEVKEDDKTARKIWEEPDAKKIKRHRKVDVAFELDEKKAEDKKDKKEDDKKEEKKEDKKE